MNKPFDPNELKGITYKKSTFCGIDVPRFEGAMTMRDAIKATFRREPFCQVIGSEQYNVFNPRIYADNVARAFVLENRPFDPLTEGGGKDIFGIEWVYVPQAEGSMEKHGNPQMEDAEEWHDFVQFPDVDSWDWEGCARENADYLKDDQFNVTWLQNGFFERLISFMGFEGAIMAMADEDQQDEVKALLMAIADTYIDVIDHYVKYFPKLDCFFIHDDWGSQKDTFFAPDLVEEIIVPAMRKVTDHIHSIGKFAELHSCGNNGKQVPNMIKAGWDMWCGQPMNDTHDLYEKYGDKIILGVFPDEFDPKTTSEEDQRRFAREYADKFCRPGKPSVMHFMACQNLTPAFYEELYKQSRINYAG